jgi:hypothetical protein
MKNKETSNLNVGNSLAFEHIKGLRQKFDALLKSEQGLTVHSEMITEIDLTGIQFLQYCMLQAEIKKKEVSFLLKIAEEPKAILLKNGFSHVLDIVLT